MSAEYRLQVFGQNWPTLQRGLYAIAEPVKCTTSVSHIHFVVRVVLGWCNNPWQLFDIL